MRYDIKAIETRFKGYTFRSRLEARWAATFELFGWKWDYEPADFNGWMPDFAIYGKSYDRKPMVVYVEVKPVISFPKEVAAKIDASGCPDEVLIVGQRPYFSHVENKWDKDCCIGWLREVWKSDNGVGSWWMPAPIGRYQDSEVVGFCHYEGGFEDRISGLHEGNHPCQCEKYLDAVWATAHDTTRWFNSSWSQR